MTWPHRAPRPRPDHPKHPFRWTTDYLGLIIDVETDAGEARSGVSDDGTPWSHVLPYPYGEVRGTEGADGDAVDVYLGPDRLSAYVYVIQTKFPGGKRFDETKSMIGFSSQEEAERAFRASYGKPGFHLSTARWPAAAWVEAMGRPEVAASKMMKPLRKANVGGRKVFIKAHVANGHPVAAHWRELSQEPAYPMPEKVGGAAHIEKIEGDTATVKHESGQRVEMPLDSVPHYVHDLTGALPHEPNSGDPAIDGVLAGHGDRIASGNDGIVYQSNTGEAVKISTTVPYQPHNRGHRTPEEAVDHLKREHDAHQALADVPMVPQVRGQEHDGRYFLVKPWAPEEEKFSPDELDQIASAYDELHRRGWALNDIPQFGRDKAGKLQFQDLGQAKPNATKDQIKHDRERLDFLFRKHGHTRARGTEETEERWKHLSEMVEDFSPKSLNFPMFSRMFDEWLDLADARTERLAAERATAQRSGDKTAFAAASKAESDHDELVLSVLERLPWRDPSKRTTPLHKAHTDRLPGGEADDMQPSDFDADALEEGTRHELEHTRDERIAREIAMDHLSEDRNYYKKLRKLEKGARFVVDVEALAKARKPPKSAQNDPHQISMFARQPPAAPQAPSTGTPVDVKAHVRQTEHGPVVVAGHIRHLDPKAAFKLKAHELEAHAAAGGESGAVAKAEIERRAAKRAAEGKPPIKPKASSDTPAKAAPAKAAPAKAAPAKAAPAKAAPEPERPAWRTPDAPLDARASAALVAKLRSQGPKIVEKWEEASTRVGNENTARRARMGAEARKKARAELERGQRMLRLADAIESGQHTPTTFDAAVFSSADHYERAKWLHGSEANKATNGHWRPTDPTGYFEQSRDNEALNKTLSSLKRYRREGNGTPAYDVAPDDMEAHDAIAKAAKGTEEEESVNRRLKTMRVYRDLGYNARDVAAHTETAARFQRLLDATGAAPKAAARWQPPVRQPSSESPADRMARAEQIEAKRWKDPEHQQIPGYFPTPAPEVAHMIERADIRPGMSVLEPSAGTGDIADQLPSDVNITVAEHNQTLRGVLAQKGYSNVHNDALNVPGTYDRVIMNPPFERGQDMAHVQHAFMHNLAPGGRLVAVVSSGALTGSSKAHQAFRDFVEAHRVEEDRKINPESWKRSGTAVSATMITLQKPGALNKGVRFVVRAGLLAAELRKVEHG